MTKASSDPTPRLRRRARSHRSFVRPSEARAGDALNVAERELLASFCPPGSALLALGSGACNEARSAALLGYRVTAVAVRLEGGGAEAGVPNEGPAIEWLESDGLTLPVRSNTFEGALVPLRILDRVPARVTRIALLREAARAVRSGGHVIVSVHNALARAGWRRSLWDYAERRGEARGWRRLEPSGALPAVGPVASSERPTDLVREAAAAGLRLSVDVPWPPPPPGALGALARRGSALRHAAFEVA